MQDVVLGYHQIVRPYVENELAVLVEGDEVAGKVAERYKEYTAGAR